MSVPTLTSLGFRAGIWQGRLTGPTTGMIDVLHEGEALEDVDLTPEGEASWILSVPVPAALLGEGVSTFVVRDRESGSEIGGFSISTGEYADDDLRAEVRLLRAELDLLKQAFRRHVAGG